MVGGWGVVVVVALDNFDPPDSVVVEIFPLSRDFLLVLVVVLSLFRTLVLVGTSSFAPLQWRKGASSGCLAGGVC